MSKGRAITPYSTEIPMKVGELSGLGQNPVDDVVGAVRQYDVSDPGFQSPSDPLKGTYSGLSARQMASIVYRDIPLVTIQNSWTVDQVRGALWSHMIGIFEQSGQLWDSILGDPRVMATLNSRGTGLFGRPVSHTPAKGKKVDPGAAQACCDAWEEAWPQIYVMAPFREMNDYSIGMGFSHSQLTWDTSEDIWVPYLRPWHPRYTYYHWTARKFIALSQDGQIPIIPGNGKWVTHAPWGNYRGWIRGAIRAVAEPWLGRHFGFRDMFRFSEIHGLPTRVGEVPAVSDPAERAAFEAAIARLGTDTSMILPKGVDGQNGDGYGYKLVEATDQAWQVFPMQIDRCDMDIVLALLFQNLTTEVKGGSFAATQAHMDVRQGGIQDDEQGWSYTLHDQVQRAFAYFNFGDANLAPWTNWDVTPRDDYAGNAKQFQAFSTAVATCAQAGFKFKNAEELLQFAKDRLGLDGIPDFEINDPPQAAGAGESPSGARMLGVGKIGKKEDEE